MTNQEPAIRTVPATVTGKAEPKSPPTAVIRRLQQAIIACRPDIAEALDGVLALVSAALSAKPTNEKLKVAATSLTESIRAIGKPSPESGYEWPNGLAIVEHWLAEILKIDDQYVTDHPELVRIHHYYLPNYRRPTTPSEHVTEALRMPDIRRDGMRAVPVLVYLPKEDDAEAVMAALHELIEAHGLESDPYRPIISSFFQRLKVWTRSETGRELAASLQRAAELRALDEVQAKVDDLQAGAAAKLITSLENTEAAVIMVGSMLLVKHGGIVSARNLTPVEMTALKDCPTMFQQPGRIVQFLEELTLKVEADRVKVQAVHGTGHNHALTAGGT